MRINVNERNIDKVYTLKRKSKRERYKNRWCARNVDRLVRDRSVCIQYLHMNIPEYFCKIVERQKHISSLEYFTQEDLLTIHIFIGEEIWNITPLNTWFGSITEIPSWCASIALLTLFLDNLYLSSLCHNSAGLSIWSYNSIGLQLQTCCYHYCVLT